MAITIASTEPSTLDAAFIAHAHSTAPVRLRALAARILGDKARRPLGNGMPMAKPSGTSSSALTNSFSHEWQAHQRPQQRWQSEYVDHSSSHDERHRRSRRASARGTIAARARFPIRWRAA